MQGFLYINDMLYYLILEYFSKIHQIMKLHILIQENFLTQLVEQA